ncbi:MAG: hypothetical protein R3E68_23500 [Burkholderiaceae bacterium]
MTSPSPAHAPSFSRRHRKPMSLLLLFACLFLQVNMALAGCLTQPIGTGSTIEATAFVQMLDPAAGPASVQTCEMVAGAALCKAQCDADDGATAAHPDAPSACLAGIALPFRPWQSQAASLAPVQAWPPRADPVPVYLDSARLRV